MRKFPRARHRARRLTSEESEQTRCTRWPAGTDGIPLTVLPTLLGRRAGTSFTSPLSSPHHHHHHPKACEAGACPRRPPRPPPRPDRHVLPFTPPPRTDAAPGLRQPRRHGFHSLRRQAAIYHPQAHQPLLAPLQAHCEAVDQVADLEPRPCAHKQCGRSLRTLAQSVAVTGTVAGHPHAHWSRTACQRARRARGYRGAMSTTHEETQHQPTRSRSGRTVAGCHGPGGGTGK